MYSLIARTLVCTLVWNRLLRGGESEDEDARLQRAQELRGLFICICRHIARSLGAFAGWGDQGIAHLGILCFRILGLLSSKCERNRFMKLAVGHLRRRMAFLSRGFRPSGSNGARMCRTQAASRQTPHLCFQQVSIEISHGLSCGLILCMFCIGPLKTFAEGLLHSKRNTVPAYLLILFSISPGSKYYMT